MRRMGISRFEIQAVIRKLLDDALLRDDRHRRRNAVLRWSADPRRHRRAGILQRQIEHEGGALAGRALQVNFTAQQARKLAADGKAEAGAAVFSAGAGASACWNASKISFCFSAGDADAGIRPPRRRSRPESG